MKDIFWKDEEGRLKGLKIDNIFFLFTLTQNFFNFLTGKVQRLTLSSKLVSKLTRSVPFYWLTAKLNSERIEGTLN